jgi:hypothetical protein
VRFAFYRTRTIDSECLIWRNPSFLGEVAWKLD